MNKKSRIQMVMRERYLVSEYKDCHSLMTVYVFVILFFNY
ncbi:Uncharacterised protein [Escherichia coli]|nr:Uncharacterised protein [Escherichia coli]SQS45794.1 Uncharacterised protein [Escherichia coli]SRY50425.1 Uncharacterised protein [Escherichia coli]